MNLAALTPHLLYAFRDERDLLRAVEELSRKFTQERERIGDYLRDERLVSAYAAFYLLTNLPKLSAVVRLLPTDFVEALRGSTFIDLGAGPGTFSIAYREWLGASARILQVEPAALMRAQAQRLWAGLYPNEELLSKAPESGEKLLFFGHSANEMGPGMALEYVRRFDPEAILFIEPGTRDFFPQMLEIRTALLARGYHVHYPCPSGAACPLSTSAADWCHQFVQVRHDAALERLSQLARKDRGLLPLTVQAFSKRAPATALRARLVRVFPETKFSFEWDVCRENLIERWQIMKRGLDREELKYFGSVLAGAAVSGVLEKSFAEVRRMSSVKVED